MCNDLLFFSLMGASKNVHCFFHTCWLPRFACVLHAACYRPLAIAWRVACCRVSFAVCCVLPYVPCWLHVVGVLLLVVACCTFRFWNHGVALWKYAWMCDHGPNISTTDNGQQNSKSHTQSLPLYQYSTRGRHSPHVVTWLVRSIFLLSRCVCPWHLILPSSWLLAHPP